MFHLDLCGFTIIETVRFYISFRLLKFYFSILLLKKDFAYVRKHG